MKHLLKAEELALFIFGIFLFKQLDYAWWWFLLLLLSPDIGMLGYLFNSKVGAFTYNLFHHRGIAIAILILGWVTKSSLTELIGVILFTHIAMDRFFGYGIKYDKGFKYTHLGELN